MTTARYVQALATTAFASLLTLSIRPAAAQDTSPLPRNETPVPDVRAALDQARDPAAAIEAYARARAADPDNPAVADAFIRKMIELNVPQLAENAARGLLARQPDHGLALAVRAYVAALRGDTAFALDLISQAISYSGDQPFVERTAGQLVAWYFTQESTSDQSLTERRLLHQIRRQLGGHREYAEAFREAREVYRTVDRSLFPQEPGLDDAPPQDGRAPRTASPQDDRAPAPIPGALPDSGYWPYDDGYVPDGYYYGRNYYGRNDYRYRWGSPYGFLPVGSYGGLFWGGEATGVPAGYAVVPGFPRLYYPVPQRPRPGDNGPISRGGRSGQPPSGPLFVGPGDKDAHLPGPTRRNSEPWAGDGAVRPKAPIWGPMPDRPNPPLFRPMPGDKPTGGPVPGNKPTNRPPPGTKPG